jgi:hypothetical protein
LARWDGQAGSSVTVSASTITHNTADGGPKGSGGTDGQGVGGATYDLGTLLLYVLSLVKQNKASTSNDNIFT